MRCKYCSFFVRSRFPFFLFNIILQLRQVTTLKIYIFHIIHDDLFDSFKFKTNALFSGKCRRRRPVFPNPQI